jgi:hypothetical protein
LPEDTPPVALRKAQAAAALAEKELAWARANLPALEARIAADKAKFASPPDPAAETLAQAARKVERQAQLLKGEQIMFLANQKLSEALSAPPPVDEKAEKVREKKIAAARKQIEAVQAALGQSIESYTPLGKIYPSTSTGRRLSLARWIASTTNPLTARVAINHMWLRHFGRALVPTVFNFGENGKPPTHPQLLDWLASEFMDQNWSMKDMHRLMVTSSVYRMQSSTKDSKNPNLAIDADNRYLWRMNSRRMEAEVVRDSLLQVAGQLDSTLGGPELDENQGEDSRRRSLYFRHTPDAQMLFLQLFDAANPSACYERNESVVPQQALAMINSKLSYTQARLLARHLSQHGAGGESTEGEFTSAAFEVVLGRPPSPEERAKGESFLREQAQLFRTPEKLKTFHAGAPGELKPASEPFLRARESLIHALFNHNEFVTIR